MNSLGYAKCACDTLIKKFKAEALPPVGRFHYHQGVFLLGMYDVYKLTQNNKYYEYIDKWLLSNMNPDGSIIYYEVDESDDMQPTFLLTELYSVNGDEKYLTMPRRALELLKTWKTNEEGGFWHKDMFPNQMWLDGMYMAGPLIIRLGNVFGDTELYDMVYHQMKLFQKHNFDSETGLWKQVVDKIDMQDNWDEVSCSSLFVYAIAKMCNLRAMDDSYKSCAKKAYDGIIDTITFNDEDIEINKVCIGTGLGKYKDYIERPVSTNDLHGVGDFLLMCAEYYSAFEQ